jgi:hypothetical protein
VIASLKRTGWLSLLAGVVSIYLAVSTMRRRFNWRFLLSIVAVGLIAVAILTSIQLKDLTIVRLSDMLGEDANSRFAIWMHYGKESLNTVLLGRGFGNFAKIAMFRETYIRGEPAIVAFAVENSYLELALAGGWVALVIFGAILYIVYRKLFAQMRMSSKAVSNLTTAVFGAMTGLLVGMTFVASIGGGPLLQLLWCLIGVALSANEQARDRSSHTHEWRFSGEQV